MEKKSVLHNEADVVDVVVGFWFFFLDYSHLRLIHLKNKTASKYMIEYTLKNLLNNYNCLMYRKHRKILVHHNPFISFENVSVLTCLVCLWR